MINKGTAVSMSKLCRSCMSEDSEMRNVFEIKESVEGQNLQIAEMLMACASIQVLKGDGLPIHLCVSCADRLKSAYSFKKQCERTDTVLRKTRVKEESLEPVYLDGNGETGVDTARIEDDGDDEDEDCGANKKQLRSFSCSFCSKTLATKKGLKLHLRRHTGENLLKCNVCDAGFTRSNHLRRHSLTHKIPLTCCDCGEQFEKAYHLIKHKRTHKIANVKLVKREAVPVPDENHINNLDNDEDLYENSDDSNYFDDDDFKKRKNDKNDKNKMKKEMECEFCDRKFKYRKSFIHHMQTEHGMSDESDVPLSTYVINPIKEEHVDTVQNPPDEPMEASFDERTNDEPTVDPSNDDKKVHVCHVCNSKFDRANHLTRHMTLHRAILTHKCDRCEKRFATDESLLKHTQEDHIDKPYECTLCNIPFNRGEHLIRHLKSHSSHDTNVGKLNKCGICDKVFSKVEQLARHTKVHLQQDKRHVCSECGQSFNRLDILKTHQRSHANLKDTTRLHLCIYCGKEFNNSSNMIVHMRRHTGERPYKCTVCDKGFPRSHDLKCHERTHSGEKPYLCTLCGKSFNKSNKLLRHTRVHTGERPYVCNLCGRAFTQSNDLALHTRRHTGSRPYACGVCPARFIQSGQLKMHRRSMGHWMETQPDLKGGYRVEPVTPLAHPTPIRFKKHGKPNPIIKSETNLNNDQQKSELQPVEDHAQESVVVSAPEMVSHTLSVVTGEEHNVTEGHSIIIDSTKLFQHLQNSSLVSFTVIDSIADEGEVIVQNESVVEMTEHLPQLDLTAQVSNNVEIIQTIPTTTTDSIITDEGCTVHYQ